MIKVVFIDVDGTLLNHSNNTIPQSSKIAIQYLKDKGIKVVLATGRHLIELQKLPTNELHFDAYLLLNGQLCLDANYQMLFGNEIKDDKILKDLFNQKQIPLQFLEKNDSYINFINDEVTQILNDINTVPPYIHQPTTNPIYQVIAYVNASKAQQLRVQLPNCKITSWHPNGVDIIQKGGGKQAGIEQYLQLHNLTFDNALAIGDGDNDVEMLQSCHIGVAMGNGSDAAKAAANHITDTIDNDGLYQAIMKFIK